MVEYGCGGAGAELGEEDVGQSDRIEDGAFLGSRYEVVYCHCGHLGSVPPG